MLTECLFFTPTKYNLQNHPCRSVYSIQSMCVFGFLSGHSPFSSSKWALEDSSYFDFYAPIWGRQEGADFP